ncbi:MAG: AraC family transcriptional regulator [Bacteroidetes bacterium]|nr:AraC family transcriptional regulator [Bacteroidota bacterium]
MKNNPDNAERINKVVRTMEQAIDRDLPLDELASLACFSPFHFQRVFKDIMGETPKQFIKRLRLEEAARIIAFNPREKILEVAIKTGYQSLEAFSRAFKDYYGISPDNLRKSSEIDYIKIVQGPYLEKGLIGETKLEVATSNHKPEFENLKIDIVKRAAQKCVYLKTTLDSTHLISGSFKRIKQWSQVRGLVANDIKLFGVVVDYPVFTPLDKCRFHVCAEVYKPVITVGLVSYQEISSARYAQFEIEGGISEIFKAASFIVHSWLPENGYKIKLEPVILVPQTDAAITPFSGNLYRVYLPVEPE